MPLPTTLGHGWRCEIELCALILLSLSQAKVDGGSGGLDRGRHLEVVANALATEVVAMVVVHLGEGKR